MPESFDLAAILEEAEPVIDAVLDEEEAFESDVSASTIADDIDDITLDAVIGLDGVVSDKDIEDIDNGRVPSDANGVDDDADVAESDPEIFKLQRDIMQNSLISSDDIKELQEGMSIEEFVSKIVHEEGLEFTKEDDIEVDGGCDICHHTPCICLKHTSHHDDDDENYEDEEVTDLEGNVDEHDVEFKLGTYHTDDDTEDLESMVGPKQVLNDTELPTTIPDTGLISEEEETELEMTLEGIFDNESEANDMDERELQEAFEAGYEAALNFIAQEASEVDTADIIGLESVESLDEMDTVLESLEDVEIFNKFEGSGINAKQIDGGNDDDFLVGPEYNKDEKGLRTHQNDDTLGTSGMSVKSFDDMDIDPSIEDMLS